MAAKVDPRREFAKRWPHHRVTTFTADHLWTIDSFQEQLKGNYWMEIKSPLLAADGGHDLQFQMSPGFSQAVSSRKTAITLFLHCYSGKEVASEVPVSFKLTFYTGTSSLAVYDGISHTFKDAGFFFFTNLVSTSSLDWDLLSGFQQLGVSIKLSGSYIKATPFFDSQLALLQSGILSDFTVVVGSESIPVHRALLAARSPVFAAMFRHKDTKEAQESQVVISDVRAEVFKDLLHFAYTGVKPKCGRLTTELLALADKYGVEELKLDCEQYLSTTLAVPTVAFSLFFAHVHSAATFKASCLKFIAAHYDKVVGDSSWEWLCNGQNCGHLVVEATRAIVRSMQAEKK